MQMSLELELELDTDLITFEFNQPWKYLEPLADSPRNKLCLLLLAQTYYKLCPMHGQWSEIKDFFSELQFGKLKRAVIRLWIEGVHQDITHYWRKGRFGPVSPSLTACFLRISLPGK